MGVQACACRQGWPNLSSWFFSCSQSAMSVVARPSIGFGGLALHLKMSSSELAVMQVEPDLVAIRAELRMDVLDGLVVDVHHRAADPQDGRTDVDVEQPRQRSVGDGCGDGLSGAADLDPGLADQAEHRRGLEPGAVELHAQ